MRKRLNLILLVVLVSVATLVWMMSRSQSIEQKTLASLVAAQAVQPRAPLAQSAQSVPVASTPSATAIQPAAAPASIATPLPVVVELSAPKTDGTLKHIVQPGETVASLAADLMGKDSRTNREAIISANANLQADPDKLLAGKAYRIPSASDAAVADAPAVVTRQAATPEPEKPAVVRLHAVKPTAVLEYTAKPGDTVSKMAASFLGSDDQQHQDLIINANASLIADSDHVEAGHIYRIPAPEGLSASADANTTNSSARPTTQPDADQVIANASPKELRYTAAEGDTLGKMAVHLLGSDTQETRDAIIKYNPSLAADPDRVIAGKIYCIPAPTASADAR